jgi:Fur family transcriptional regulator, peroxide stress response regulator
MRGELLHKFRELCRQRGLAVTHQRTIIYEALFSMSGHPSPEQVYTRVRQQIPSISLATVYKTINTFLETGIVHEASPHHGSIRLDSNLEPHHHMICTRCKTIFDLDQEAIGPLLMKGTLPNGFRVQRFSVEVLGLCERCANSQKSSLQGVNQRLAG